MSADISTRTSDRAFPERPGRAPSPGCRGDHHGRQGAEASRAVRHDVRQEDARPVTTGFDYELDEETSRSRVELP
jgi:hypothetical protein